MGTVRTLSMWAIVVGSCVPPANNPPPPQQWQQQQPQQWQQPAQPAQPAASYTPCQYACGQISRCQISAYESCVEECRGTGAEQQEAGRQVLENISRMTCEQIAVEMSRTSSPTATTPPATYRPPAAPTNNGTASAGRWVSAPSASYTNAGMVSADFFLDVTVSSGGAFRGSWARYVCFAGAYGILSCSKGSSEGSASGQLDANGSGWIDLQNLGRSSLSWSAPSANELSMELPRNWQGENVLFRSKIKR